MLSKVKPVVLLILDGWGYREERDSNAILGANTPTWDRLWSDHPHTLIHTSGAEVGLPGGQMGNSEVGHLNLGAGRVVYQELTRVSRSVRTGSFFTNRTLTEAVDAAMAVDGAVHIFGLLSPGGVHSQEEHIQAMVRLAVERGAARVYLHAFLDGRDTPPRSAHASLAAMQALMAELGGGRIATLCGRYYAMDRDNRWERVRPAYDLLTLGVSDYAAESALEGLSQAYQRGEGDEFVKPTRIGKAVPMQDGDSIIFMNFRADRAREITRAFIEPEFTGFPRQVTPRLSSFVCLTEYNKDFEVPVAFPPERLNNGFGEYLAKLGLHQLRLAETEKYAHVTFFFNGGVEQAYEGEERILVPSPKVATYDLQPEMSAAEVTAQLVAAIRSDRYEAIICNYANADMVGHTGHYGAAVRAVETLDRCLAQVVEALTEMGGELLLTADHGNAEMMLDPASGQPHTAHTNNPVPLIYLGRPASFSDNGALCDIAPTLLSIMGLKQPQEMMGRQLLHFTEEESSAAGSEGEPSQG